MCIRDRAKDAMAMGVLVEEIVLVMDALATGAMAMGVLAEEVVLAMDTLAKAAMAKDAIARHLGMRRESGSTTTPARRSGQIRAGRGGGCQRKLINIKNANTQSLFVFRSYPSNRRAVSLVASIL